MHTYKNNFWKKNPFVRIVLAFMAGILLQWYWPFTPFIWMITTGIGVCLFIGSALLSTAQRFRLASINGLASGICFISLGALLCWSKDVRNSNNWIGHRQNEQAFIVKLIEPPVQKTNSLKAVAATLYSLDKSSARRTKGRIILYFNKQSKHALQYGSVLLFKKRPVEISPNGNPGGFDYKQYAIFHGITHQLYLDDKDIKLLNDNSGSRLNKFIFASQQKLLAILRRNIKDEKELGLAEALLIGYKNDLDPSLVQSYSNTGVVHIIAISGLHLGLIYWLLSLLLRPLKNKNRVSWLVPVIIISSLWLFSLLAGAQPSILRSALMFTCIVLGDAMGKKSSIYNTMAFSAFIILCTDPFSLWDVGFQLSYSAVLSIIIFMRPVYNCFYIQNKLLDNAWQMNAVTISAQILTTPFTIYHFHQFPILFLLTNFLAVPLSGLVLLIELAICGFFFIPSLGLLLGTVSGWLISFMNAYIEKIDAIPFAVWQGLQISLLQAILLMMFLISISVWMMKKTRLGLLLGLPALLIFICLRSASFIERANNCYIIIYNIPKQTAIDFVEGRKYYFVGDNGDDKRLLPTRTLYRLKSMEHLKGLIIRHNYIEFLGKKIMLLNRPMDFHIPRKKLTIDLLIISGNIKVNIKELAERFSIRQIVFDSSTPSWNTSGLKSDCDSLQIRSYNISANGAFVMTIP